MRKNPLALVLVISAVFFVIFVVIAVGTVKSLGSGKSQKSALFAGGNSVGVVELKGVIVDSKHFVEEIEDFSDDAQIRAVIVRINSPGGSVAPSQEMYDAIKRLSKKKPVFVSMGSVAASGGYYAAVAAKKIYANPGTITGSIGVISQFADLSKLYQWAKINPYTIKTGKYKDSGSPTREMTADEKALIQGMMENVLGQFRHAVATGRNLPMEKVVALSDGRIFSGEQAKAAKLVDELGSFSDAVEAVAKEAGIKGKPTLVYAVKKKTLVDFLTGNIDEDESSSSSFKGDAGGADRLLNAFARAILGRGEAGHSAAAQLRGPLYLLPYAVE